ncbi:hypothetical protein GPALN_006547 [Globodera pallida]|nr:hypothetical protein GPALN_006547 [Globodera pallida]
MGTTKSPVGGLAKTHRFRLKIVCPSAPYLCIFIHSLFSGRIDSACPSSNPSPTHFPHILCPHSFLILGKETVGLCRHFGCEVGGGGHKVYCESGEGSSGTLEDGTERN